jgi:hypothetical protein
MFCAGPPKTQGRPCGATGAQNVDAHFFILRWVRCGTHKKQVGTHHTELAFLHLMGSAGHVVRPGASGARNIDALFFMLRVGHVRNPQTARRDKYTELMFLHLVRSVGPECVLVRSGHETSMHYFPCSCAPTADATKSVLGHITSNLYFCIRWDLQVT